MFHVDYLISLTHLCLIAFLSLYIVLIDVSIYSAAQLQQCLINLHTDFPVSHKTLHRPAMMRNAVIWSKRRCFSFPAVSTSHELYVAVNDVVLARQQQQKEAVAGERQTSRVVCLHSSRAPDDGPGLTIPAMIRLERWLRACTPHGISHIIPHQSAKLKERNCKLITDYIVFIQ